MKNVLNILFLSLLFVGTALSQSVDKAFFNQVDSYLKNAVSQGLVDYSQTANSTKLSELIRYIETADLTNASDDTKKAFFINAYNLNVIHLVGLSYPTDSPMDISGFFDSKRITVAGNKLTLNKLEKDYLLKEYGDARFHFVLVCGAMGCPPITNFAYTPEKLEAQLEQQTRNSMNNSAFLKVSEGTVELSQIFKWYADDFGGSKKNVIEFINRYKSTSISAMADVSYYSYDWTLNDTKKKKIAR